MTVSPPARLEAQRHSEGAEAAGRQLFVAAGHQSSKATPLRRFLSEPSWRAEKTAARNAKLPPLSREYPSFGDGRKDARARALRIDAEEDLMAGSAHWRGTEICEGGQKFSYSRLRRDFG
jgi:hypothetical protein